MYKLIFVDGIMGSGKSTTATFVANCLEQKSISARVIGEGDEGHPIQMKDPEEYESIQGWMAERLMKWAALKASILQSGEVFVLDGQLFHECVDALFYFDVPEMEIKTFVSQVMDVIQAVNPALIYLYQGDVRAALRRTCDERGAWWENWQIDWKVHNRPYGQARGLKGFEGFVQLYINYRQMTDRLFDGLDIEKLAIESGAGDWVGYNKKIKNFLV